MDFSEMFSPLHLAQAHLVVQTAVVVGVISAWVFRSKKHVVIGSAAAIIGGVLFGVSSMYQVWNQYPAEAIFGSCLVTGSIVGGIVSMICAGVNEDNYLQ